MKIRLCLDINIIILKTKFLIILHFLTLLFLNIEHESRPKLLITPSTEPHFKAIAIFDYTK